MSNEPKDGEESAAWLEKLTQLLRQSWAVIALILPALVIATRMSGSLRAAFWGTLLGGLGLLLGGIYWLSLFALLAFKRRGANGALAWLAAAILLAEVGTAIVWLSHHPIEI